VVGSVYSSAPSDCLPACCLSEYGGWYHLRLRLAGAYTANGRVALRGEVPGGMHAGDSLRPRAAIPASFPRAGRLLLSTRRGSRDARAETTQPPRELRLAQGCAREPAAPGLGVLRLRPRGAQPIRSTVRREPKGPGCGRLRLDCAAQPRPLPPACAGTSAGWLPAGVACRDPARRTEAHHAGSLHTWLGVCRRAPESPP